MIIQLVIALTSPGSAGRYSRSCVPGMGGRRFRMYKFRSMVPNAEELKASYAHLNELQWPDFKITNDPRIAKLGVFYARPVWMNYHSWLM
ncbi:MAG: sugar transferase [Anaerolineales bacterium]|nr:sugar transferase [Anaerolineales bacterium]